jgi:hypothetical protein
VTDPARLSKAVADFVAVELDAREAMARHEHSRSSWSATRSQALRDLKKLLGTWQKVADATGQKLPTVHKAASQPRKKKP